MVRKLIRASIFAAFGMVAVALAYGSTATAGIQDKGDKVPDISEIMTKGHKGTDAYLAKIKIGGQRRQVGRRPEVRQDSGLLRREPGQEQAAEGQRKVLEDA